MFIRRYLASISGKFSRSFATEISNSFDTPTNLVDIDKACLNSSKCENKVRVKCAFCKSIAAFVTSDVMFGLPSLSPPIQVPNLNGRASSERLTPNFLTSVINSAKTSGTVSSSNSSR